MLNKQKNTKKNLSELAKKELRERIKKYNERELLELIANLLVGILSNISEIKNLIYTIDNSGLDELIKDNFEEYKL